MRTSRKADVFYRAGVGRYLRAPPASDTGSWAKTVLYNNISQSNRPQAPVIVAAPFLYGTLAADLFGNGEAFRLEY